MNEKDDILDSLLSEYLEDKQNLSRELHPYRETFEKLETLKDVPERDPDVQAQARAAFLAQVRSMPVPISKTTKRRLIRWNTFFRRERSPMTTILGLVLAVVVAFGGAGTTAYAAQDSLPNEPLYPVKQFTEQFRLALTSDTEAEVHLLLDLSEERVGEMVALSNQGSEVPEETQLRLQEHLRLALAKSAQLGDAALESILQRIKTMAQNQIQAMQQAKQNIQEGTSSEAIQNAITAINQVRQAAQDGLEDPLTFRQRQGSNRPENVPDQPENMPPVKDNDVEPHSGEGSTEQGHGDGTGEGGGANGNGNGDGTSEGRGVCGDGYGDGTGEGGGAYSNGDGVCDCACGDSECDCTAECTPQGLQNGHKGPGSGAE